MFLLFVIPDLEKPRKRKFFVFIHLFIYLSSFSSFLLSLSFLASNYFIPLVYFLLTSLLRAYSLFFIHSCVSIITFYSSFPFIYSLISSLYFIFRFFFTSLYILHLYCFSSLFSLFLWFLYFPFYPLITSLLSWVILSFCASSLIFAYSFICLFIYKVLFINIFVFFNDCHYYYLHLCI